ARVGAERDGGAARAADLQCLDVAEIDEIGVHDRDRTARIGDREGVGPGHVAHGLLEVVKLPTRNVKVSFPAPAGVSRTSPALVGLIFFVPGAVPDSLASVPLGLPGAFGSKYMPSLPAG